MRKKGAGEQFWARNRLEMGKGGGQTCARNAVQYGNKNWNFKKEKTDLKIGPE